MAKNDFLQKQKDRDRRFFEAGMMFGCQLANDFHQISLHDRDLMGSRTLGREALQKVAANCSMLDDHYHRAFTDDVDADYLQEEMDGQLREIFGDDLIPFAQRYPIIKQYSYLKPRKGWK